MTIGAPIEDRVLTAIAATLGTITIANGYHADVSLVRRTLVMRNEEDANLVLYLFAPLIVPMTERARSGRLSGGASGIGAQDKLMSFTVGAWINVDQITDTIGRGIAADIEAAVLSDRRQGGLVMNSFWERTSWQASELGSPWSWLQVDFSAQFCVQYGRPDLRITGA